MSKKRKSIFVPMALDFVHAGHLNIIKKAKKYGEVIIGLLTDDAIKVYKNPPVFNYEHRYKIISALKDVAKIEKTEDADYRRVLNRVKPDYIIHGTDWRTNNQKKIRDNVINQIKEWKGKLIEVPYTEGISSTAIKNVLKKDVNPKLLRTSKFKEYLNSSKLIRIIEVHNGLSAIVAENAAFKKNKFHGMWLSSLTHSTSKGRPDTEYVDDTTVSQTLTDIFDCSSLPLILDADSGGKVEHFRITLQNLERLGVSAVIIEDKIGSKINSLSEKSSMQKQDSIEQFSLKISAGKKIIQNSDMLIIARIESLIVGKTIDDAILRAKNYIDAGADGIMIHSKKSSPKEIFNFCYLYNQLENRKPLVVVPSSYSGVYEKELKKNKVNIVIYANHLLRSAYPAMLKTAESILRNERSYESKKNMMPISDIVNFIEK